MGASVITTIDNLGLCSASSSIKIGDGKDTKAEASDDGSGGNMLSS